MNETAVSKLAIPPSLFLFRRERLNELWRESTPAFRLGRLTFFLQSTDKEFYLEKSPQFPSFCAVLGVPVKTIFDFPGASTHAGVTTRLKTKQARQLILASLSFWPHVSRVFDDSCLAGQFFSRDALAQIWRRKGLGLAQRLKSTGLTLNGSRELSGGKNSALVRCTQKAILV